VEGVEEVGKVEVFLEDGRRWRGLFETVGAIADFGAVRASSSGLLLKAMSPDHTQMVKVELPRGCFDEYTCSGSLMFGVDVAEVLKVAGRVRKGESARLSFEKSAERGETLTMVVEGLSRRVFRLSVVDAEFPPDIRREFEPSKVMVKLVPQGIYEIIDDLVKEGSAVTLMRWKEGQLELENVDETYKAEVPSGSEIMLMVEVQGDCEVAFNPRRLWEVLKVCGKVGSSVTMFFEEEKPIRVEVNVMGAGKGKYWISQSTP